MRRRFSGRREVALGLGAYAVYLLVRAAVDNPEARDEAAHNARRLAALERRLGLDVEERLQRLLVHRKGLMGALSVGYVNLNVLLTVGSVGRLYAKRHPEFHRVRRGGLLAILLPSAVFYAFPCEPPRKLEHLVDAVAEAGVDLDSGIVVKLYNPIAAFPSIHMAFAVVTATAVLADSSSPAVRALARAYPGAVAFTVLVTANHFVLDVLGGTAVGLTAVKLSRWLGS